jgi:membrane protein insertase Oxa1/YidC/SpoIIIJ
MGKGTSIHSKSKEIRFMRWYLGLMVIGLISLPTSLAMYWLVFHLWPVSWAWFVFFMFLNYGEQQFAQYCAKRMIEAQKEEKEDEWD